MAVVEHELLRTLHRMHRQKTDLKSRIDRFPKLLKTNQKLVSEAFSVQSTFLDGHIVALYAVEKTDDDDNACEEEDEAMEQCVATYMTMAGEMRCLGCLSYGMADIAEEIHAMNCADFQQRFCNVLVNCPCSPCRAKLVESINCELEWADEGCPLLDCDFSSEPTPAPTTGPPTNTTTLLTMMVHFSTDFLSTNIES